MSKSNSGFKLGDGNVGPFGWSPGNASQYRHTIYIVITVVMLIGWGYWAVNAVLLGESGLLNEVESELSEEKQAADGTYVVTKVVDGDTLWIDTPDGEEKVRLIGIDTPELNGENGIECFAEEAKLYLTDLVLGKNVILELDETQGEKDRYGRTLGYIWLADDANEKGLFINQSLLRAGYGHEYTYNLPYLYQDSFMLAERVASEEEIGLWASDACTRGL